VALTSKTPDMKLVKDTKDLVPDQTYDLWQVIPEIADNLEVPVTKNASAIYEDEASNTEISKYTFFVIAYINLMNHLCRYPID
jgi:hypothetical protein